MPQTPERILTFMLPGERCGVDLDCIAEIVPAESMQPIPRTPSCFRGIQSIHGALVPVLDLAAFLHPVTRTVDGQLLVLKPDLANLALLVSSAERIEPAGGFRPSAEAADGIFPLLATVAGTEVRLLDPELLVSRLTAALAGN